MTTIFLALLASRLYRRALAWAAARDLDVRAWLARARLAALQVGRIAAVIAAAVLILGCPKPQPEPVPADCDKPGQACADDPHAEGPPPVGSLEPPR